MGDPWSALTQAGRSAKKHFGLTFHYNTFFSFSQSSALGHYSLSPLLQKPYLLSEPELLLEFVSNSLPDSVSDGRIASITPLAHLDTRYTMSLLPAEITAALERLVQALQSPDNATRSQAEEQLHTEWVGQRPEILLMGLVEQLRNSQDVAVGRSSIVSQYGS